LLLTLAHNLSAQTITSLTPDLGGATKSYFLMAGMSERTLCTPKRLP